VAAILFGRSKFMPSTDLNSLMALMRTMIEAETTVSEFYRACSGKFCENEKFWTDLANEESMHAEMLSRIVNTIKKTPQEFQVGKTLPIATVKSFVQRIRSDLNRLQEGRLNEEGAIAAAFHIESTFIEQKYVEVIETQNQKYLDVLTQLQAAEVNHKSRIAQRMKGHKSHRLSPEGQEKPSSS
jgi:rubrerythrin